MIKSGIKFSKQILTIVFLFLVGTQILQAKIHTKKKNPEIGVLINVIDHDYENITDQQLNKIRKIGYKTIELGAYTKSLSPRFMITYSKLKFKTMGCGSSLYDLQNSIDEWIRKAHQLNQEYIICYWPWLDGAEHITREQCEESARIMNEIGEKCFNAGIKFAFHNHALEFGKIDGEFIVDLLLKNTNPKYVSFELDIYHMLKSGNDPIPFMENNASRITILHLFAMDNKSKYPLVGEGMNDFDRIINTGLNIGVDYLILEGNDLEDPMRFVEESYPVLKKFVR
ncbi:MAG TPA: hypothetical protein DCL77_09295 [Prolixibacteraceae bacterium]|jgi:sugar phosphate isomerase/epimerase|nr:hypothetical protein [Prolixibacteraceae bacterium]